MFFFTCYCSVLNTRKVSNVDYTKRLIEHTYDHEKDYYF